MTNNDSIFTVDEIQAETWKPIPGFEGYYSVSNLGRVRRDAGGPSTRVGRINMGYPHNAGYPQARLCRDSKVKIVFIHKLVAEAFIGPRPKGLQINHINKIKTDNRAINLEYVTPTKNIRHSRAETEAARQAAKILTLDDIRQIRQKYKEGGYSQAKLAAEYGIREYRIWRIVKHRCYAGIE